MPVSQLLAIIPQRQPGQMRQGHLQHSKAASRDAIMGDPQPTSRESTASLTITWPLPCPRSPHHLQVRLPWNSTHFCLWGSLLCKRLCPTRSESQDICPAEPAAPSHLSRQSASMGNSLLVCTQVPVYDCEQPFVNCDSHCVFMWLFHSPHISLMVRRGPCPGSWTFSPTSSYSFTLHINVNVFDDFFHRLGGSWVLFSSAL